MRDLKVAVAAREGYIQEEIARSLAQERDLWQRKREAYAVAREREGSASIEIDLLREYISILISEKRGHRMPVPPAPYIPGRDPFIHRHELVYMPAPSGLTCS